jgi:hypothetical protein
VSIGGQVTGRSPTGDPPRPALDKIESRFRDFILNEEMSGRGLPYPIPTLAAKGGRDSEGRMHYPTYSAHKYRTGAPAAASKERLPLPGPPRRPSSTNGSTRPPSPQVRAAPSKPRRSESAMRS